MKFLILILFYSSFVQAQVVIDRGGGNVSQGQLSDYVFIHGNAVLDSKLIQSYLSQELQKVREELPSLYHDLLKGFPTWFLSKNKISSTGCRFKSAIEIEHKTAACMTYFSDQRVEVVIDYHFWQTSTLKLVKQLLVHEMVRSLQIRKRLPEEALFYATVYFSIYSESEDSGAALELRRALYSVGFDFYLTEVELTSTAVDFAHLTKSVCHSKDLYSQRISNLIRELPTELEIENLKISRAQKNDKLKLLLLTKRLLEFSLFNQRSFCEHPVESALSYLLDSSHF